jgi:CheY-like chemotaxis protein
MNNEQPPTKILIIDDDPDFIKLTTLMLDSAPYQVISANNPKEGREKLLSEKPDLILLDIMMDSMFDGYSLCNDIKTSKEYEKFKDTPIIFVSAVKKIAGSRFGIDLEEQGLRGPDDYLDKPVQAEELNARIKKLLNM